VRHTTVKEADCEPSIFWFYLQIFLVPLGCLVCGLIFDQAIEGLVGLFVSYNIDAIIGYISFGLVGLSLGYATQSLIPRTLRSGGTWIWVFPLDSCCWGRA